MTGSEESASKMKSERGEIVIPVHDYVQRGSLAQSELNTEINRLLALGVRRFALDFGQVSRMRSPAIGVLVQAIAMINDRAGEWRIINVPPRVKDVLNVTGVF